jgi:hypothetical protein
MIIYLLSVFGLSYLIKEVNGPFNIISLFRNKLMMNKYIGVFFFQLFDCFYCIGFHSGWIMYIANFKNWQWYFLPIYGLVGAAWSLIVGLLLQRITEE